MGSLPQVLPPLRGLSRPGRIETFLAIDFVDLPSCEIGQRERFGLPALAQSVNALLMNFCRSEA